MTSLARVCLGSSLLTLILLLLLLAALPATAAAAPAALAFEAGEHNILDSGDSSEAGLELRFAPQRLGFLPRFIPDPIPLVGVMATSKSIVYGYAGFRLDFPLGQSWVLAPGFAAGLFSRGHGQDLGGPVEFRSSIELARRIGTASRLGLLFYHLSNADLYHHNPGSESLALSWTVGF